MAGAHCLIIEKEMCGSIGVPTDPHKRNLGVEAIECFLETASVGLLSLSKRFEPVSDFVEAFFACGLGHTRVHVGVLVGFTGDGRL
jgi:hypothetical protein